VGGRVVELPKGCTVDERRAEQGTTLVASQAALDAIVVCRDGARIVSPSPIVVGGRILALFTASHEGDEPTFSRVEDRDGVATGVFSASQYCGGMAPQRYRAAVLVELDHAPRQIASSVDVARVDCPVGLP
jgi:hypothetical protein